MNQYATYMAKATHTFYEFSAMQEGQGASYPILSPRLICSSMYGSPESAGRGGPQLHPLIKCAVAGIIGNFLSRREDLR